MSVFKKEIFIEVYNTGGAYITTWRNFTFSGFSKALNGGPGECVIQTDMPFDYGGNDLILGNDIEIRISDVDTVAQTGNMGARTIYKGYISLIERDADGQSEGVTVHILGYYTLLTLDVLKNGAQTTLYSNSSTGLTVTSGSLNAADVGLMMRTVVDRYIAETTNPKISYRLVDIPNTSTTGQYIFKRMTYRDALVQLQKMSPSGVWFYVDELGFVKLKTKPATATHEFVFGRHFKKVHVEHSLEKMRNFIAIWDGVTSGNYKHYENDGSIGQYGRRFQVDNDYGASSGAMDLKGPRFLSDNALPDVKVTCQIADNNGASGFGYDIESIQPGDTCTF